MAARLENMDLTETQKKILGYCGIGRSLSEIGMKLDKNYAWVWQLTNRMVGKGLMHKIKTMSGRTQYKTNDSEVIL